MDVVVEVFVNCVLPLCTVACKLVRGSEADGCGVAVTGLPAVTVGAASLMLESVVVGAAVDNAASFAKAGVAMWV